PAHNSAATTAAVARVTQGPRRPPGCTSTCIALSAPSRNNPRQSIVGPASHGPCCRPRPACAGHPAPCRSPRLSCPLGIEAKAPQGLHFGPDVNRALDGWCGTLLVELGMVY